MKRKRPLGGTIVWIVASLLLILVVSSLLTRGGFQKIDTDQGLQLLSENKVDQAKVVGGTEQRVDLTLKTGFEDKGKKVQFFYVTPRGDEIVKAVNASELSSGYTDEIAQQSWWSSLLIGIVPFIIFIAIIWFVLSQSQGGGSKVMQFGKNKAKIFSKETSSVTFADVAGAPESVEELGEIKDFLTSPDRFQAVGAKIPKGVLLYGPPGTGKTLLARAVAGEANVPFYSISGSDFVEMFVGVGASRVRDLFKDAKENAPAIVFIDEIDAVGRHRGAGMGGGHDEREQTLNQLLVEMDGFDPTANVIMIAATNRPDILDPALLRPGRFDRQIGVEAPDLQGRTEILQVHAKGKPIAEDVDLVAVARRTPGFSGADLANVLNEAALLTARSNNQIIDDRALDEAIDRVMAGPQKRSRVMKERERQMTAYHEGGHALVAAALRNSDPVTKITILPRGRALGYTMVMPVEDKHSTSRNELLDQLAYMMGGRVAEEIVFHDPTTGASNDIEKATSVARRMVTEFGMSAKVGSVKLGEGSGEVFMGRDMGHGREYSENLASVVDSEVRGLLDDAHDEAWTILTENRDSLDLLVIELMEKETLNQGQIAAVFTHLVKQPERMQWLSAEHRFVSDRPPVGLTAVGRGEPVHHGIAGGGEPTDVPHDLPQQDQEG